MPNLLKLKRGTAATIPVGSAAEPLFTTDTYDLYIGKGNGSNQRFQKYIASGTSSQFLKGDGSLDSTSYQTALTFSSPLVNTSGTISIPAATGSVNGYLTSTDWTTFNSKEPAITAGTSLQYFRGDKTFQTLNTSVVPESGAIYFTEPRVLATVLTGLNLSGGGTIAATDSVLTAFGKIQNQISGIAGGVSYQTTWNASTNTPTLTSSVGTKGYYYVVSVAGSTNLNGITDWKVGDWAIFNGTTWDKVDNTDAVSSVNGFTGAVNLGLGDISNVTLTSPTNGQLLQFNGTSSKWVNWTPTYISGNQTITLSGDISGSGTTAITTTIGALKVTNAMLAGTIDYAKMDGTTVPTWNQNTTGSAATLTTARTLTIGATGKTFNGSANVSWSLAEIGAFANPMTTLGDIIYGGASGAATRLAGNTVASKRFLTQTGDGTNSAAPSWGTISAGDIPSLSYLPLTGGTLTGALSGTSATFSGDLTASGKVYFGTFNGSKKYYFEPFSNLAGGANNAYFVSGSVSNSERSGFVFNARNSAGTEYNAVIIEGYNSTSTTPALSISSTGAATFSGALSGTSATFSGNITTNGFAYISPASGNAILQITRTTTTNGAGLSLYTNATQNWLIGTAWGETSSNFVLYNGGTGTQSLKIDYSTNAATFSSSVTANATSTFSNASSISAIFSNGGSVSNYNSIELRGGTAGTAVNWQISKDNSTANAFELAPSTAAGGTTYGSPVFKILNTGAATFSSSVTANGLVTINKQNEGLILTAGANTDASYMSTRANNSTGWLIIGSQGSVANYIQSGTGANESAITTVGAYALALGTNQTERMRITSGGNVGIGTTSPISKLSVAATSSTTDLGSTGLTIGGATTLTSGNVLMLNFTPIGADSNRARAGIGCEVGADWGKGNLTFYTKDASSGAAMTTSDERMRITSGGATQIKGTLQTYAPGSSSVLGDTWKLGGFTNTSVAPATGYLYVQVNGASYYIGLVNPL